MDFSNISYSVNFNYGPRIDIFDSKCSEYLVEFYERIQGGWGVKGTFTLLPYHFYCGTDTRFRNDWKIKVWGWLDNQPVQLMEHTYNETDKKVLLVFDSDSLKEQIIWYNLAKKFQDDFKCTTLIKSKFSEKLNLIFNDSNIIPLENDVDGLYATYRIGRYNIPRNNNHQWGSGFMNPNQARPKMSFDHPNDWYNMTSEQLFNDIMNL